MVRTIGAPLTGIRFAFEGKFVESLKPRIQLRFPSTSGFHRVRQRIRKYGRRAVDAELNLPRESPPFVIRILDRIGVNEQREGERKKYREA